MERRENVGPRSAPRFLTREGLGFSIELKAFPIDGRLEVLPPDNGNGGEDRSK